MSSQKQQPAKVSKLEQLREREKQAESGGGTSRVEKQHATGKMTARERIEFLLDEGTFQEFDLLKSGRIHPARRDALRSGRDAVVEDVHLPKAEAPHLEAWSHAMRYSRVSTPSSSTAPEDGS